jgi:hypothetical protein
MRVGKYAWQCRGWSCGGRSRAAIGSIVESDTRHQQFHHALQPWMPYRSNHTLKRVCVSPPAAHLWLEFFYPKTIKQQHCCRGMGWVWAVVLLHAVLLETRGRRWWRELSAGVELYAAATRNTNDGGEAGRFACSSDNDSFSISKGIRDWWV